MTEKYLQKNSYIGTIFWYIIPKGLEVLNLPKVIKTKVVGVTKKNEDGQSRQELIEMLEPGDELFLEREPDNEHDENAIAVFNESWEQIGYLSRSVAAELAPLMDEGYEVECTVTEITGGTDDKPSYGCNIEITIYSPEEWAALNQQKQPEPEESIPAPKEAAATVTPISDQVKQAETSTQEKTPQQKWMERAEKLERLGQSMQDAGKKTQRLGCALTLLFTFPIVGLFFGPIGFIVGAGLGLLLFIGMYNQKNKQ